MRMRWSTAAFVTLSIAVPSALAGQASQTVEQPEVRPVAEIAATPAKPIFTQKSMNVFRRYPPEQRGAMVSYYDKVLGLTPLTPIQVDANTQMILFRVGATGQIKLNTGLKASRAYALGGIDAGTGIRLFVLRYPDEAALAQRFAAAGQPAPAFRHAGGRRAATVPDPAGFPLVLVIDPQAAAATPGVEVGINVADLAASRAFYRDFVGLQELPPVADPVLGVTKYPFRNGETTISLWSKGTGLPADTGSAGIQYVIGNIHAVNAAAKARRVAVETPLGGIPGFPMLTVWLNDPDGVTNYFYQTASGGGGRQQGRGNGQ